MKCGGREGGLRVGMSTPQRRKERRVAIQMPQVTTIPRMPKIQET